MPKGPFLCLALTGTLMASAQASAETINCSSDYSRKCDGKICTYTPWQVPYRVVTTPAGTFLQVGKSTSLADAAVMVSLRQSVTPARETKVWEVRWATGKDAFELVTDVISGRWFTHWSNDGWEWVGVCAKN